MQFINSALKTNINLKAGFITCLLCLMLSSFSCKEITEIPYFEKKEMINISPDIVGPRYQNLIYYNENKDISEFLILSIISKEIQIFDIHNNVNHKVKLNVNFEFDSGFILSRDSIFLVNRYNGKVLLTDINSGQKGYWDLPVDNIEPGYKIKISSNRDIIFNEGDLNLTVFPRTKLDYFYKFNFEMMYSLVNDTLLSHFLKFPKNYNSKNWWSSMGNNYSKCINSEKNIIYSFPCYKNLIIFNYRNINEIEIKGSKYLDDFPPKPFNIDSTDNKYAYLYRIDKPHYVSIIYDPYRNRYYRIVAHAQQLYDSNGRQNEDDDRSHSIMIFDENFKIIGEQEFEKGEYNFFYTFVTKKGLLVALNTDDFEDNISFQHFIISSDYEY